MMGDEWAKDIKEIYGEYIEKHRLHPANLITKILMKFRIIKVTFEHYKIKNPLVEQMNKETIVFNLLPKKSWADIMNEELFKESGAKRHK